MASSAAWRLASFLVDAHDSESILLFTNAAALNLELAIKRYLRVQCKEKTFISYYLLWLVRWTSRLYDINFSFHLMFLPVFMKRTHGIFHEGRETFGA